jgi:hypothetical protein
MKDKGEPDRPSRGTADVLRQYENKIVHRLLNTKI